MSKYVSVPINEGNHLLQVTVFVNLASQLTIISKRRDKTANGNDTTVGKQFCHFRDTSNIFFAVFLTEIKLNHMIIHFFAKAVENAYLNPRFLLSPVRMLSPSRPYAGIPFDTRYASNSKAIDVLPAPLYPVNQMVQPRNPRHVPKFCPRYSLVILCFCSVTFVATCRH